MKTAISVLAEAKENKMLSYDELFLLHEPTTLGRVRCCTRRYRPQARLCYSTHVLVFPGLTVALASTIDNIIIIVVVTIAFIMVVIMIVIIVVTVVIVVIIVIVSIVIIITTVQYFGFDRDGRLSVILRDGSGLII